MIQLTYFERLSVDGLLAFWQTGKAPATLAFYISLIGKEPQGGRWVQQFLERTYTALATDRASLNVFAETQDFQRYLLENIAHLTLQSGALDAEATAAREKATRESQEKAQRSFDALGEQMRATILRDELVELGRQRATIALSTGRSFTYENHCWRCKEHISSEINARCPACHWYICGCGACGCGYYNSMGAGYGDGDDVPF